MRGLEVGHCVVIYLGSPREQVFGILLGMSASGVVVRGLTIGGVDDWLRELEPESAAEVAGHGLATTFYPMHRVEKMSLDEPSYGAPPIQERFRQRTGLTFAEFIEQEGAAAREPATDEQPE